LRRNEPKNRDKKMKWLVELIKIHALTWMEGAISFLQLKPIAEPIGHVSMILLVVCGSAPP
jgi:hypothetical protein